MRLGQVALVDCAKTNVFGHFSWIASSADRFEPAEMTLDAAIQQLIEPLTGQKTASEVEMLVRAVLGPNLADHMASGAAESSETARAEPDAGSADRLAVTYAVIEWVTTRDSAATARAWFTGLNPSLGDRSPAEAIRDGDFAAAIAAAKTFAELS